MSASSNSAQRKSSPPDASRPISSYLTDLNGGKMKTAEGFPDDSIWKSFLADHPVVKFQRPDYFLIFHYTDSCKILYQENINLDLGGAKRHPGEYLQVCSSG
jgi:hypothetical protein